MNLVSPHSENPIFFFVVYSSGILFVFNVKSLHLSWK